MTTRSHADSLEALVAEQRQRDAELPLFLKVRKLTRMRRSPHAFLRGTARFFYALVRTRKSLERLGRGREGWLCGDLHVENFGVFRTNADSERERESVVFDVNDFDDAVQGPQLLDVLRLTTSLLLAARGGVPGAGMRLDLAMRFLQAYDESFARGKRMTTVPHFIRELWDRSAKRRGRQLVAERTEGSGKSLRFVRGERYRSLSRADKRSAHAAFVAYAASSGVRDTAGDGACEILDAAYRVAGTGSLGAYRVAVLTRGRKGHAPWLFDMKEERESPSPAVVASVPKGAPASRVVAAAAALLANPPAGLGTTELDGRSMLVRRLSPQEDKVSLDDLMPNELDMVLPFLGSVVGEMHRRGVSSRMTGGSRTLPMLDHHALLAEASTLAGLHETAHLLYFVGKTK